MPPGGSIIFTSSALVGYPAANSIQYGSSKAAVSHAMQSIAAQVLPLGIRVNAVAPPLVYTPFIAAGGFVTELLPLASETLPLGRVAQPAELAPHWVDLADPSKTYMSGEIVAVSGGLAGF